MLSPGREELFAPAKKARLTPSGTAGISGRLDIGFPLVERSRID
jgi:hypothetical protein